MKNFLKTFCIVLSCLGGIHAASADILTDCMDAISNTPEFSKTLTEQIFQNPSNLNQNFVTSKKNTILGAIGATLLTQSDKCTSHISKLASKSNARVNYERDGKKYAFQFKMLDLFNILDIPVGIMVYNKQTVSVGDVIKLSDIPQLYWSGDCSDHHIWDNLSDDAGVNVAGQKVFSQYGGSKNEFFLDFEEGNNRRAFPGLVLMDETGSTSEHIVQFTNLPVAIEATKKFATALGQTVCAREGLSVYLVSLGTIKFGTNDYGFAAGVAGGTMAFFSIGTALAGTGIVAATGSMAAVNTVLAIAAGPTAIASSLLGAAGATSAIPYAGWIASAVLAAAAAGTYAVSMIPGEIADIQQVMVLDGPYPVR